MKILAFFFSFVICSFPVQENIQSASINLDIEIGGNKQFAEFLGYFEKSNAPLSIDHTTLNSYRTNSNNISPILKKSKVYFNNELKDYLPIAKQRKFSRMGGPIVTPLHRFYPDENMVAVTYLVTSRFTDVGFSVMLSLFDLKGNPILKSAEDDEWAGNAIIIASLSPNNTVLSSSNASNKLLRTKFKNNWKKDISEFGLSGNTIANYEKEKSDILSIQADGKVEISENLYANVVLDK